VRAKDIGYENCVVSSVAGAEIFSSHALENSACQRAPETLSLLPAPRRPRAESSDPLAVNGFQAPRCHLSGPPPLGVPSLTARSRSLTISTPSARFSLLTKRVQCHQRDG